MDEKKMCSCGAECTHCTPEEKEATPSGITSEEPGSIQSESMFALLLALTPLAVFTFFGQVGLL